MVEYNNTRVYGIILQSGGIELSENIFEAGQNTTLVMNG